MFDIIMSLSSDKSVHNTTCYFDITLFKESLNENITKFNISAVSKHAKNKFTKLYFQLELCMWILMIVKSSFSVVSLHQIL